MFVGNVVKLDALEVDKGCGLSIAGNAPAMIAATIGITIDPANHCQLLLVFTQFPNRWATFRLTGGSLVDSVGIVHR